MEWHAQDANYPERWFCRHCELWGSLKQEHYSQIFRKQERTYAVPDSPKIDQGLADRWHKELYKLGDFSFFEKRGISREWIDRAKLGFRPDWNRWAIPCFYQGKLYAIQYRARKPGAKAKYLSETGSFSNLLFGSEWAYHQPAIAIVESPLDAIALWSHGYPAVAKFDGNSSGKDWYPQFETLIYWATDRIVVADNDARTNEKTGVYETPGRDIARNRQAQIAGARIVTPPDPYKDVGEMFAANQDPGSLLGMPRVNTKPINKPCLSNLTAKRTTDIKASPILAI